MSREIKFAVYNKKHHRFATVEELNMLIDGDEGLFFSWGAFPSEREKGVVNINIDSGCEDEFEIIKNK